MPTRVPAIGFQALRNMTLLPPPPWKLGGKEGGWMGRRSERVNETSVTDERTHEVGGLVPPLLCQTGPPLPLFVRPLFWNTLIPLVPFQFLSFLPRFLWKSLTPCRLLPLLITSNQDTCLLLPRMLTRMSLMLVLLFWKSNWKWRD